MSGSVAGKMVRKRAPRNNGGQQQPRLADVAKAARVSTATVSRVMNTPEIVTEEIRERVHSAIQKLKWVPNATAKSLRTSRTHTVGAIMPTLDHQNFARIVQSLQTTMAVEKYELLVGVTYYNREVATQQARAMVDKGVEALVLVGADHPDELMQLLEEKGIPFVLLYVAPGSAPGRNVIGYNNYQAFVTMTEHLLSLGHRTFGLIAQDTSFNDRARARQEGVRTTLAEQGIAIRPRHFIEGEWKFEDGMKAFEKIMRTDDPPSAIICGNDYLAIGCMLKAREMGIDIPGDVSITGFDDIDLARLLQPGITTMKVPDELVGEMAGRFFIDVLRGKGGQLGEVPAPELIMRGSTSRPKPN
ncbi:LacI family transcriptional regulator [Mesorhizobium sp. B2-4-12]|nr:LacI family transcriptional regulator [Mesorhizobium sp. B2-4-12]TPL09602.1 LacI family transcriptional regulator [Mesorhizobium sp. B2-4-14]